MPDTERLYAKLDEERDAIADIREKGNRLRNQIGALITAFAQDYACKPDGTLDYVDGALLDLISDAEGPAIRRKYRWENEIGDIEYADERRSAPAVL